MTDHPPRENGVADGTERSATVVSFDPEADRASERVVSAVAAVEGTDPTSLELLAEVVDPDSLDGLFQPSPNGQDRPTDGLWVRFRYAGHVVVVDGDGTIAVSADD